MNDQKKAEASNWRILLVDDTPANLAVLKETLTPEGYKLAFANTGEKALEITAQIDPDLILLDVMMPGIDGYETCTRLKQDEKTKDIPIIFITAKKETEDVVNGFKVGGIDYIPKPFQQEEVCSRVRTHLELNELKKSLEQKVIERTKQLNDSRLEIVGRLGKAAEYKDNETGMHVVRMSHFSELIARELGMDDHYCEVLLNASPMHDIGKIGIPDRVLLKPGKLDHDEWEIMKSHTTMGAEILSGGESEVMKMSEVIALTHQEKWNGSGYPQGLKGEDIPLEARIVAIADVFDALTSIRPYKKAWTVEDAAKLIEQESGNHFDPKLVPLFLKVLPEIVKVKDKFSDSQ